MSAPPYTPSASSDSQKVSDRLNTTIDRTKTASATKNAGTMSRGDEIWVRARTTSSDPTAGIARSSQRPAGPPGSVWRAQAGRGTQDRKKGVAGNGGGVGGGN